MSHPSKTAVVLFNLGGPDSLQSVKPFLSNLFNDPKIIRLPKILRSAIAWFISTKREKEAQSIYRQIGGKSPLLENTLAQAHELQKALGEDYRVFTCMRYWHPRAEQVLKDVQEWQPDQVILLPLYPQFSTTTTQSSFDEWFALADKINFTTPTAKIGCYPFDPFFLKAYQENLQNILKRYQGRSYRVLFSAHGLPQKIVDQGDPYAWQVQTGVEHLVKHLDMPDLDWSVTYQSRVGPVEWLKPYTDHEIVEAAKLNKGIIIVPIAFVSEHSETLVELDIQYKNLAMQHGAPFYDRVPTVSIHPDFIECLKQLVLNKTPSKYKCPEIFVDCICRKYIK